MIVLLVPLIDQIYAVTYGYDDIKVINSSRTILVLSIMQKMHITLIQLSFFYRIINVASDPPFLSSCCNLLQR